jgi:hypothetical protein
MTTRMLGSYQTQVVVSVALIITSIRCARVRVVSHIE